MDIEFGLCSQAGNTQFAPLAALCALYQHHQLFQPLAHVPDRVKKRRFSLADQLIQIFLSMLAGCETLSEVNIRLRPECSLAHLWGWEHFADQSTLSRSLDQLSLKQIEAIRLASTHIWHSISQIPHHNWHAYLWLEYDLSGLPCSKSAQESQKGYFSGKKTQPAVN
jgi:hypothetical protein